MKLKHLILAAATCLLAVHVASADPHTITWSAQNEGAALGDITGAELPPGSLVRLGYFAVSADEVRASFNDVLYLDSEFIEVAREKIGNFGGVLYQTTVETIASNFDVAGAFAQTVTLESEMIPAGARFYIWTADSDQIASITAHALFSANAWQLTNLPATALQWGIESVDPANPEDVYLADQGPEESISVGGTLNKFRVIELTPEGPGDLEDPDSNGIVALLEEAFLVDDPKTAHFNMPFMSTPDTLVYYRKAGGNATDWDLYQAGDLEYRVEASPNFQDWFLASELLGSAVIGSEDLQSGERIAVRFATSEISGLYFRVHVRRIVNGG